MSPVLALDERDARQHVAGLDLGVRLDRQDGIDRQQVAGIDAARDAHRLAALRLLDDDRGLQVRAARGGAPIDDDAVGRALHLVGLLLHRHALDQVGEVGDAVDLGQDRPHVGIPLREARAALDLVAVVDVQPGAVGDLLRRQLLAGLVDDDERHVAAHGDQPALAVLDDVAVLDLHLAVEVGLDEGLVDRLRHAADVERAHGELGARLADRLRGDDADRLADVDRRAARQIAAVALGAHAVGGLAGQHRADAHLLDLRLLDRLDLLLLDAARRT